MKKTVLLISVVMLLLTCACNQATESSIRSGSVTLSQIIEPKSSAASSVPVSSSAASSVPVSSSAASSVPVSPSAESTPSLPSSAAASSAPVSVSTSTPESSETEFIPDSDFNWALILVNKISKLDEDYAPPISDFNSSRQFDSRAVNYLKSMVSAAKADGIKLNVISTYRTPETQRVLYERKVTAFLNKGYSQTNAEAEAAKVVAPPGTSEHCTGLAADIVSVNWYDNHAELTYDFDETKEYDWLSQHAAEYGFVLRYPKDKIEKTMIDYEPWHYRFVGVKNAEYITENGLCLEEFVETFGN